MIQQRTTSQNVTATAIPHILSPGSPRGGRVGSVARIPVLDPEQADPGVRAALERLPPLAIFGTVANAQGSFVNWLRFGGDCLDARWFDPVLRELAILRVARLTPGAGYEWT